MTFRKPGRPVSRVFVHCSASDNPAHDSWKVMDAWHRARGWSGIGYHFFIRKDGVLEKGRDIERTPAAQARHNTGTIAICCHGLSVDRFTPAQFHTLRTLCIEIDAAYGGKLTFHGHKEVAAKACPVLDYRSVLGLDRYGNLGISSTPSPVVDVPASSSDDYPDLDLGDRGPAVERLQTLLNKAGEYQGLKIEVDGIYGQETLAAVLDFKEDHGLYRSALLPGYVWRKLEEAGVD